MSRQAVTLNGQRLISHANVLCCGHHKRGKIALAFQQSRHLSMPQYQFAVQYITVGTTPCHGHLEVICLCSTCESHLIKLMICRRQSLKTWQNLLLWKAKQSLLPVVVSLLGDYCASSHQRP